VASAIDQNGPIAAPDQCRNLIAPIATVTEAAVEQNHRGAGSVSRVPDPSSVVFNVALATGDRQRWGAVGLELPQVVVELLHLTSSLGCQLKIAPKRWVTPP
jgi:hypothetical protein